MLAADITSANTFICRSTSEPELCRNVESINCEDTVTSNGYANYNHTNNSTLCVKPSSESSSSSGDDGVEKREHIRGPGDVEITFQAFEKLRSDLERAQQELRSRDDQCRELSRVRDEVDQEIEELTASLFEEAHKMVNEANVGRASAEKKLYETQLALDGLQAEVATLKLLVITSTPTTPKSSRSGASRKASGTSPGTSRMCSYCDTFVYNTNEYNDWTVVEPKNKKEVDPVTFQYFVSWIEGGCPLKENDFLGLILKDDISPCLRFADDNLSKAVYKAVQSNTLAIEPIQSKPKKCSLCYITGNCPYRIRLADTDLWYPISASCRAKIVTVIDFLTFLRYIRQGILKKDINVLYWDMMKHRTEICLARLGMERKLENKK